ncbi:MAG: insulinase family protein [Cellvibrionales bacterium]|nr:MAG: insulinase family protein [Cellvibrionales bacterium]
MQPRYCFLPFLIAAQAALAASSGQKPIENNALRFNLKNGLQVIVLPDHRAATAVQMLWLKVGSIDETDGSSGVAHVLEHMAFKGTPTVPAGEFSKRIAAMGGQDNAFTSYDYTAYYQSVPAARLPEAMQLEADRLGNLNFSDAEFAKEIEVIKEERRMRTDDKPRAAMGEMMNAVTYSASPYRRPVIGWMDDLQRMTAQDARQFHQTWYEPSNAALVIVGDVQPAQVKTWAEKYYGGIPNKATMPQRKQSAEPPQRGMRRMQYQAVAEQPVVSLAFKIPSFAASKLPITDTSATAQDIYALVMLAEVLDGYEGARLARQLTQGKNRVADSVGASAGLLGRGPETFTLQGVPAAGKSTAQLEAALRGEVTRIAKDGVSEKELQRVKNQYAAGEIFKRDSLMGQAQELGMAWVLGLPADSSEILIARLSAVTPAQVQAVAQRYFGDDELTVGSLVPVKAK